MSSQVQYVSLRESASPSLQAFSASLQGARGTLGKWGQIRIRFGEGESRSLSQLVSNLWEFTQDPWGLSEKELSVASLARGKLEQCIQQGEERRCSLPFMIRALVCCSYYEEDFAKKKLIFVSERLQAMESFYKFVKDRGPSLIQKAQEQKGSLYIRPKQSGLDRAIHFTPLGRVFVHLNRCGRGDSLLGKGAHKVVKLARELGTPRLYASAAVADLEEVKMLQVFAGIEGFVQFADTVSYFRGDSLEEGVKHRILYHYYNKESLVETFNRGEINFKNRKRIFEQLIRSVAQMHRMGYLHRDLKPDNIFLGEQEGKMEAVIGDLETACRMTDEERRREMRSSCCYISPEYAKALLLKVEYRSHGIQEATTEALDDWSLACTLFLFLKMGPLPAIQVCEREKKKVLSLSLTSEELQQEAAEIRQKIVEKIASLEGGWFAEPRRKNSPQHLVWRMIHDRLSARDAEKDLDHLVWISHEGENT